jgi:hypothetical protein
MRGSGDGRASSSLSISARISQYFSVILRHVLALWLECLLCKELKELREPLHALGIHCPSPGYSWHGLALGV